MMFNGAKWRVFSVLPGSAFFKNYLFAGGNEVGIRCLCMNVCQRVHHVDG